eukprot:Gregarina_sp_Poly_1__3696@NODE_2091_length_2701_cov_87_752468_g902_i1_p1_GENE_NODE_2091_length_2701_cov_87_752468_g902_i1NODE_2091_length_2701_cov_87_752468_g902_i1_p1_ORF_typecomplete_len479_score108_48TPR_1/PF00515_28/0_003TPR_1/PF00515_28/0_00081TPR_2/PF07719_17/0_004TPR_2/PF07719_17/0_026TPR_11/PF13414_6/3_4e06TPR_11/PF13414_6/1_4TPR_MalT/PF17874_1/1_7e06TPR_12/PF13424_6/0_00014DUF3856/PF12968_7/0_00018TPR_8/PF13181_6/0_1TPR_8/PF13181_6/4_8TPR_19/PF14559_6/0_00023TPR_21/PF09976_9/36TPR_21/PF
MQVGWERARQPSPFVCIGIILISLALFFWRVWILVSQRLNKEAAYISNKEAVDKSQAAGSSNKSPVHRKPNSDANAKHKHKHIHRSRDALTKQKKGQQHSSKNTPGGQAFLAANSQKLHTRAKDAELNGDTKLNGDANHNGDTKCQGELEHDGDIKLNGDTKLNGDSTLDGDANWRGDISMDDDHTKFPNMEQTPPPQKSRLDLLDEIVSDFSDDSEDIPAESGELKKSVRQSSVSQSPGTLFRRSSSAAPPSDSQTKTKTQIAYSSQGDKDPLGDSSDESGPKKTDTASEDSSEDEMKPVEGDADVQKMKSELHSEVTEIHNCRSKEAEESTEKQDSDNLLRKDEDSKTLNTATQGEAAAEEVTQEGPLDGQRAASSDEDEETSDEERSDRPQRSDAEAERLKLLGNEKYTQLQFEEALDYYSKAIDMCPKRSKGLAAILFCNMAAVYFSQKNWEECVQACGDSIELDPSFVKVILV